MVKPNRNASPSPKKKAEKTVLNTNQKKTQSQSPIRESNDTHRVSVYKNEFMKKFITKRQYRRLIQLQNMPKQAPTAKKKIYSHITDSLKHKDAVSSRDQEEHNNLVKLLLKKKENNTESRGKNGVDYKEKVKSYLKFLAVAFKQRMSFE